jgi:hypothetical protein
VKKVVEKMLATGTGASSDLKNYVESNSYQGGANNV